MTAMNGDTESESAMKSLICILIRVGIYTNKEEIAAEITNHGKFITTNSFTRCFFFSASIILNQV